MVHPLFFDNPVELITSLLDEQLHELSANEMKERLSTEYGVELPLSGYQSSSFLVWFNLPLLFGQLQQFSLGD